MSIQSSSTQTNRLSPTLSALLPFDTNFSARGFSVIAPEKALEIVQVNHEEHQIRVEKDEVVTTD